MRRSTMINGKRITIKIRLLTVGLGFIATMLFCDLAMLFAQDGIPSPFPGYERSFDNNLNT